MVFHVAVAERINRKTDSVILYKCWLFRFLEEVLEGSVVVMTLVCNLSTSIVLDCEAEQPILLREQIRVFVI